MPAALAVRRALRPQASGPALDGLPTPSAAWSVRRLLTSWTGAAMQVRRVGTADLMDVPFTASGHLDTAALTAFAAGAEVRVTTWYDQSGAGRHLAQAGTSSQPVIVGSGDVITTIGGRPTVTFNGSTYLFNTQPFLWAAGSSWLSLAGKFPTQGTGNRIFAEGSGTSLAPLYDIDVQGDAFAAYVRDDTSTGLLPYSTVIGGATDGVPAVFGILDSGTAVSGTRNGVAASTAPYSRSGSLTLTRFALMALERTSTLAWAVGTIGEVVAWAPSLAARSAVTDSQRSYFGV